MTPLITRITAPTLNSRTRALTVSIFELMPAAFTLTALQRTVEAISGRHLHKQNFRRLVESTALVEPTGDTTHATGGRPAALYRFRRDVVAERPAPGLRV